MIYNHSNVPGYTNHIDFEAIHKICEIAPDSGTLLEIGTLFGRSTLFFAETLRKLNKKYEIYSLDLFPDKCYAILKKDLLHGDLSLIDPLRDESISTFELVSTFCRDYPEITLLKQDLFFHLPLKLINKQFSVIFEDSLHTYDSTLRCLEAYYPMLEKNGIYCGDDYNWGQVQKAVDNYSIKNNLNVNVNGKVWYLNVRS